MAVVTSFASDGLDWWSMGIGDVPEVEVSILVFPVLTRHPSGMPLASSSWHRKRRSSSGTTVETSSMNARRFVMPPYPSSWGLPWASLVAARFLRAMSRGSSNLDITSAPRMGESGHPCVDPSFMRRDRHLLSSYLK